MPKNREGLELTFSVEFFGYGAGLVLTGWIFGMVFKAVMNAIKIGFSVI